MGSVETRSSSLGVFAVVASLVAIGCSKKDAPRATLPADAGLWDAPAPEPEPRPGMVWIAPGVLIAGTPPDKLPRVADEEMAGEQVVMRGFYIDTYPYPNEAGAIPTTNVTHAQARALCEQQGKRLCTELEIERACKGPANTTYEYGDAYRAAVCATGTTRTLVPAGLHPACQSAFGVHDLHGGVWTWTASEWGRDAAAGKIAGKAPLMAVRGGNGPAGERVGRCANGRALRADDRRDDVGTRCCAGEQNSFEVVLNVTRGEPLRWQQPDDVVAPALEKLVPADVAAAATRAEERYKVERTWTWHPIGNEELVLGGGCARTSPSKRCGVVVARVQQGAASALTFVSTEKWEPQVGEGDSARELFVYGGDELGAFRRRVTYEWGKIAIADKERKKKRKGKKDPTWD